MADVRRTVRQWLEAEEAFGVSEVPLPRPAKPARARQQTNTTGAAEPSAPAAPRSFERPVPAPGQPVRRAAPPPAVPARPAVRPVPATLAGGTGQPIRSGGMDMARKKPTVELPPTPAGDVPDLPPIDRAEKLRQMAALKERTERELGQYLSDVATRVVFGEGDVDAPILFIGEGPGIEEDRQGRPFVGRSGQLLDKQINAMGFQRQQVFIANIVKLRSASYDEGEGRVKDRPPTPEEVARNIGYLHEQIAIIRPQAIVTLGAPAIKWLTGTTEGVMKLRGNWQSYRGIPVMPTYHPAFLLRAYTDDNRRKVWEDLQKVMEVVGKKPPAKGR